MSQAFVLVLTTFALSQYDSSVLDVRDDKNILGQINRKEKDDNIKKSSKSCQRLVSYKPVTFYSEGMSYPGQATFEEDCTCALSKSTSSSTTYPEKIVFPEKITYDGAEYSVVSLYFDGYSSGKTAFKEVTFPKTLKTIPANAFRKNPIEKITWGGNEETINDAFPDAEITEVVLPKTLKYVNLYYSFQRSSVLVFSEGIKEVNGILFNAVDKKIFFYAETWKSAQIKSSSNVKIQFYHFSTAKLDGTVSSSVELTVYSRIDSSDDLVFKVLPQKVLTDDFRIYYSKTGGIALAETFKQKSMEFTIPTSFTEVSDKTVDEIGPELLKDWAELMDITIPKSIKTINASAFSGCEGLFSINFEEGSELSMIMSEAFAGTSFSEFTFGDNIRTIGPNIFNTCKALESVSLPATMTTIDENAFSGCASITTFTIRNTATTVSTYSGCTSISGTLVISEGIQVIDKNCFVKTTIKTLKLPESITTISMAAFYTCTSLTGILKLPSAIQKIDANAFGSCSSLSEVHYCGVNVISTQIFRTTPIESVYVSKDYTGDKFGGISVIKALDDRCEIDPDAIPSPSSSEEVESSPPIESTPTDEEDKESSIPVESTPSEEVESSPPIESTPTDDGDKESSLPIESTPSEEDKESSLPVESTPTDDGDKESSLPIESTPSESTPTESTPTGEEEKESSSPSKPDEGDKDPTEPGEEEKPDDKSEANQESTKDGDFNANINTSHSLEISVSVVAVVFIVLAIVAIVLWKTPILKKCCNKNKNEVSSDSGNNDEDGVTIFDKDIKAQADLKVSGNEITGNNLNLNVNCCAIA